MQHPARWFGRVVATGVLCAAGWAGAAAAGGFAGPDDCATCHADEHAAWKSSIHARAYSPTFEADWKKSGSPPRCLGCHTTGQVKGTLQFAFRGITCESCHGRKATDHPGSAKMPIPSSSQMCLKCHDKTYKEWIMSRHGQKAIRCFDCHPAHGQGLRAGGGQKLCESCHPKQLEDFAHRSHRGVGVTCAPCHLPRPPGREDAIAGTGAAGHTLSVGGEVCSRCHEESDHRSGRMPPLRNEIAAMKKQMVAAGVTDVFALKEQARDLEWRLNRLRQGVWLAALLGGAAGFALGWLGAWFRKRRPE